MKKVITDTNELEINFLNKHYPELMEKVVVVDITGDWKQLKADSETMERIVDILDVYHKVTKNHKEHNSPTPVLLEESEMDFSAVIDACTRYINALTFDGKRFDLNNGHQSLIVDEAIKAVYGTNILGWVNDKWDNILRTSDSW